MTDVRLLPAVGTARPSDDPMPLPHGELPTRPGVRMLRLQHDQERFRMPSAAPSSLSLTQQLADAYGEAWNAHDVDALLSATLARAFPIGDATGQPTGETAEFDTVDLIRCDQGKVAAKDTYLDGFAMWRGMHFSEPSVPPRT